MIRRTARWLWNSTPGLLILGVAVSAAAVTLALMAGFAVAGNG